MSILDEIIAYKHKEVVHNKALYPEKLLKESIFFKESTISLKKYILRKDLSGIIAEFKRKSPSKGLINEFAKVEEVSVKYMQAGASALSILTDEKYFGGSNDILKQARQYNYCPILRKDFIIDKYQIIEAKSIGADAILLIAAALDKEKILELSKEAKELGLEILFEIHNEEELEKINDYIDIVGVNNRNLKTFEVSINNSLDLVNKIPDDKVKISESGLRTPQDIIKLKKAGFNGFLIGEMFMKSDQPGLSCANFINQIEKKVN